MKPKPKQLNATCRLRDLQDGRKLCKGGLTAITYKSHKRHSVRCEKCGSMVSGHQSRSDDVEQAYPQQAI